MFISLMKTAASLFHLIIVVFVCFFTSLSGSKTVGTKD